MNCTGINVYDFAIYDKYNLEEINQADSWLDHDRDYFFTYAGLRQVVDKYLVQDRSTGKVLRNPTVHVYDDSSDNICRVS